MHEITSVFGVVVWYGGVRYVLFKQKVFRLQYVRINDVSDISDIARPGLEAGRVLAVPVPLELRLSAGGHDLPKKSRWPSFALSAMRMGKKGDLVDIRKLGEYFQKKVGCDFPRHIINLRCFFRRPPAANLDRNLSK